MATFGQFASTSFKAFGQNEAGKFNERVAWQNAHFMESQALDAEKRGKEDESDLRVRIRQQIGTARAAYAAQGVQVSEGSVAETEASIAYMGEKDAVRIRNNAAREAWGYRVQAWNAKTQAKLARAEGRSQALGTVLGSAGSYYNMKGGSTSKSGSYGGWKGNNSWSPTGSE